MNNKKNSEFSGGCPRIRSFVVRQGRMTKRQQRGLSEGLPLYGLELSQGMVQPAELFPEQNKVVLEIGFGMGQSLIETAEQDPSTGYLGIEVHPPGMGSFLSDVMDAGVSNVKVYQDDAIEVLKQCIPDYSLDVIQVFFPDPWHKKRHNKRRLVSQSFLDLIQTKLKPGGELHMATDWQEYAEQVFELLNDSAQWQNCCDHQQYYQNTGRRPETKFERRGKRLGHGVWDLLFKTRVLSPS